MNVFKVSALNVKFSRNIALLADEVSCLIHLCLNHRLCLVKMIVLNQNSIFSVVHSTKHQT